MPIQQKVFAYVTRVTDGVRELLVFDSLDEPGLEVPKGAVEDGESLEEAVHRELLEEAGITDARIIRKLGAADWGDERQHFFLVEPPPGLPRSFEHTVTGNGVDAGLHCRFRWRPLDRGLHGRLVQGCGRFVDGLLAAFGSG
jgi:8-oxo-dGTP pyrophosphatase MutT (NUDIX family)